MRKVLMLAMLPLAACSYNPPRPQSAGAPPALALQKENPRLALLEEVLSAYFVSDIANRPTVCAMVNGGAEALSPDDEVALIERFSQLAPLSRCADIGGVWRDAETEQPALVFALHSFTCASTSNCTGWVGYRAGAAASMSYLYTVEWQEGAWRFARDSRAIAQ